MFQDWKNKNDDIDDVSQVEWSTIRIVPLSHLLVLFQIATQ